MNPKRIIPAAVLAAAFVAPSAAEATICPTYVNPAGCPGWPGWVVTTTTTQAPTTTAAPTTTVAPTTTTQPPTTVPETTVTTLEPQVTVCHPEPAPGCVQIGEPLVIERTEVAGVVVEAPAAAPVAAERIAYTG